MKKVLLLAPKHYITELKQHYSNPKYKLIYVDSDRIFKTGLKKYLKEAKVYDGYLGLVDDSVQIAAILALKHGRPGPSLEALLNSQNKLISRGLQKQLVPSAAVNYFAAQDYKQGKVTKPEFPLFIKPIRASMSFFAHEVETEDHLRELISSYDPRSFARINNFSQIYRLGYIKHPLLQTYGDLIAEEYIKYGTQVTLDGFIADGKIGWFGFTKSVFLPNRISFKRFDFPFDMPAVLSDKITKDMAKLVRGLGLDNSLFNIELKIDLKSGRAKLIEINPRPSSQFMYPIKLVTGVHPLDVALDIAVGETIGFQPVNSALACSVCILRRKNDAVIKSLSSQKTVKGLEKKYPGLRVNYFAWPGDKLSDFPQDSLTFRYGEVVIPHAKDENVNQILAKVKRQLKFKFANV